MTTIPSTYAHSDAPRTVSVTSLRKVWAIVTLTPCASLHNIGALAGIRSVAEVGAALQVLRDVIYYGDLFPVACTYPFGSWIQG